MIGENVKLEFVQVVFEEGGPNSRRWQAVDFVFKGDKYFKHRMFAPQSYSDRRIISANIRHIFDVFGASYDDLPYKYSWREVVLEITKALEEFYGIEIYCKALERRDRWALGEVIPFLSIEPTMNYEGVELMLVNGNNFYGAKPIAKEEKTNPFKKTPQEIIAARESGQGIF